MRIKFLASGAPWAEALKNFIRSKYETKFRNLGKVQRGKSRFSR